MFFSLMGIYDGKLGESEVCILLNDVTEKTNFVKILNDFSICANSFQKNNGSLPFTCHKF
jgi:hypothetical protein